MAKHSSWADGRHRLRREAAQSRRGQERVVRSTEHPTSPASWEGGGERGEWEREEWERGERERAEWERGRWNETRCM